MPTEAPRGRITADDVWKAADALLLAGERPTIERVRRQIGRGSPNTVAPLLDRWFASLGCRLQDPKAFSLAGSLPDQVRQAAKHLWEAAAAAARSEVEAQYRDRLANLDAREAALERGRQALEEREIGLRRALDEVTERARAATALAEQHAAAIAEREAELSSMQRALADEQARRANAEHQFAADRQAFDRERLELSERVEAERRRATLEIDRARQSIKEAHAHVARSERALVTAKESHDAELARERTAAKELQLKLDAALTRGEVEAAKAAAADAERQRASERADLLVAKVDALQDQLQATVRDLRERDVQHAELLRSIIAAPKRAAPRKSARRESP